MKILTIVGARPQFIKAAVVSRAIADYNKGCEVEKRIEEKIVHTGQHYDQNMSDIFFEEMQIPKPHYNLAIGSGSHAEQTGNMMMALEKVFLNEKPDMVLVYGDTNSTLAGSLTAAKIHIPVVHVEAGLRSFNRDMPEEINRILTDQISALLLCPTDTAVENLKNEGIPNKHINCKVVNCGDTMNDAAIFYGNLSTDKWLKDNKLQTNSYILATIHRAESTNTPERLSKLITALDKISRDCYQVVWPMHPRTKAMVNNNLELKKQVETSKIKIIEPIGYLDMVCAEKNCRLVLTDSGGVQKEAFFHKKLCVTMRTETEWVELVKAGWNKIAGLEPDNIIKCVKEMLTKDAESLDYPNLYGNGIAGRRIVEEIVNCFK